MKAVLLFLLLLSPLELCADAVVTTSSRSGLVLRHFLGGDTSAVMLSTTNPNGVISMFVGHGSLNSLRVSAGFPHEIVSQAIDGIDGVLCVRFYSKATPDIPSRLLDVIVVQSDRVVRFASDGEFQVASDVEPDRKLAAEAQKKWMEGKAAEPGATDNPDDAQ